MVLPPLHRPPSVLPPCWCSNLYETEMQGEPCLSPRYTTDRSQTLALSIFLQCPPSSPSMLCLRVIVLAPVGLRKRLPYLPVASRTVDLVFVPHGDLYPLAKQPRESCPFPSRYAVTHNSVWTRAGKQSLVWVLWLALVVAGTLN